MSIRIRYSKKHLMKVYNRLVEDATFDYQSGNIALSIEKVEAAAQLQYYLNVIYTDSRLENLIDCFSKLGNNCFDFIPEDNNILFYDCFAFDNRGLTQQYIDAICQNPNNKVLFVHENDFGKDSSNTIKLLEYLGVRYVELGKCSREERQAHLIEIINDFKPSKVFCHLAPESTLPLIVLRRYKNIEKYQINLTDHAFWLGSSVFDYIFEFREYGFQLSKEQRGIDESKLLYLPYYPWVEQYDFQGFPIDVKDKVVLLSAGAYYKIEDSGDTFFHIVRGILEKNRNIVFLLAGDGNRGHLQDLIESYGLDNRFLLLGNRSDINQVFAHSDIYLSTYPLGGGLVSQFAALNSLPILMYKSADIEEVVCTKRKYHFSYSRVEDLIEESYHLASDEKYRKDRGSFFRSLISDQNDFRRGLSLLLQTKKSSCTSFANEYDFDVFYLQYLDRINSGKLGLTIERLVYGADKKALTFQMWFNLVVGVLSDKVKSSLDEKSK